LKLVFSIILISCSC